MVAAGFLDRVARVAPAEFAEARGWTRFRKRKAGVFRFPFESCDTSLDYCLFVHQTSSVYAAEGTMPKFVVYLEVVRPTQRGGGSTLLGDKPALGAIEEAKARAAREAKEGPRGLEAMQDDADEAARTEGLSATAAASKDGDFIYGYMKGVTAIEPSWLAGLAAGTPLCRYGEPLESPAPQYDRDADELFCWSIPTFGDKEWKLPPFKVRACWVPRPS